MQEYEPYEEQVKSHCYQLIREQIESIDPCFVRSIYALSFHGDDEPSITLTLGYNTLEHLEKCTPPNQDIWCLASDTGEAKWNYAFWLQNVLCVIGEKETESAAQRDKFVAGILPGVDVKQAFIYLFVRISRQSHQEGIIDSKFGRAIPVIIHELEYYDQIAHQTSAANPNGIAEEFVEWFYSDAYRQI